MKIFKSSPAYFLNIYDYTLLLVYKISMSTYFMYGYIPNVYTITDVQVWSHTPCTYSSLDQIRNIWLHSLVATPTCVSHDIGRIWSNKEYVCGVCVHTIISMMIYMLGMWPYIKYMDILILYTNTKV